MFAVIKNTSSRYLFLLLCLSVLSTSAIIAQKTGAIEKKGKAGATKARNYPSDWWTVYGSKSADWYKSKEAITIANNILTWQTPEGGWPLMNTTNEPWTGDEKAIGPWGRNGTFVHGTTNEIRFLSKVYLATKNNAYKLGVVKGVNYIFVAQTPTGGWRKAYPLHDNDYKQHITFNDGCMANAMIMLKEIYTRKEYSFLDSAMINKAKRRYDLGVHCILQCQIVSDGKLTAWCQQHDEYNYQPRPGRTFEPAAISGSESVGVIKLLMDIDNPSPKVRKSIESAVNWLRASAIKGHKVISVPDPSYAPKKIDIKFVPDPDSTQTLWARFYELETNRPVFYGRDGIKKYQLAAIDQERRTGYGWYTNAARSIEKDYQGWAVKWGITISPEALKNKPEDRYFLTSDSIKIHYLVKGKGTPVILIHGLSGTAYGNWFSNGVGDALAKTHQVIALDCRNHGLSDQPAGELAWGSEKDVIELMDHLKIKKAHLHGYSMGGSIVAQLMEEVPERIITASMGGYGIPESDPAWIAKVPPEKKGTDPQAQEAYQKLLTAYAISAGMTRAEAEHYATTPRPARKKVAAPKFTVDLTKINFPVMTLIGEYDAAVSKSHRFQRELKNYRHVTLPGKSHNTAIMAGYIPPLYISELVSFIDVNDQ